MGLAVYQWYTITPDSLYHIRNVIKCPVHGFVIVDNSPSKLGMNQMKVGTKETFDFSNTVKVIEF